VDRLIRNRLESEREVEDFSYPLIDCRKVRQVLGKADQRSIIL